MSQVEEKLIDSQGMNDRHREHQDHPERSLNQHRRSIRCDVAKLSFANSGITSSQPLFVNDRKVVAENQFLQFNETDGMVRAEKIYVQSGFMINGQKPLVQSDHIKMDPSGSVLVRDLKSEWKRSAPRLPQSLMGRSDSNSHREELEGARKH